jgi:hypothetical protein
VADLDGQVDDAEHGEQVLGAVTTSYDDRRQPAGPATD